MSMAFIKECFLNMGLVSVLPWHCSAGSQWSCRQIPSRFRAPWCACFGLPTVGRMDGWVGEQTTARRSWRISPGQTRSTNSVSRNIMLHWLFFLARETMSRRKNPAVAQQCRHQPSITCSHYCCFLMCLDSFSQGNKQLKHLLLHCPEHSFGVAMKINHLRRREGKGINLQWLHFQNESGQLKNIKNKKITTGCKERQRHRAAEATASSKEKRTVLIKAVLVLLSLGSFGGLMIRSASHLTPFGELNTWRFLGHKDVLLLLESGRDGF